MKKRFTKKIVTQSLIFATFILVLILGIGTGLIIGLKNRQNIPENRIVFEEANMSDLRQIQEAKIDYEIENNESILSNDDEDRSDNDAEYVASSRGKKYYPIDCKAAESLSEDNLVYFSSQDEAEENGYTKSTSCNF